MLAFRPLLIALFALPVAAHAVDRVQAAPVPPEMRSTAFTVRVNGQPVDVAHAAANYEYVSFDVTGPVMVEITAAEKGFWDKGVDIQPWRLGLRPTRTGQTIRFRLSGPAKLSISRPGDFLNYAKMLFLFAGAPPPPLPRDPKIHAYQPGVYHGSLNPKSGETLYLAPGSYFFGSLNLWKVENVKVLGRGTIVYDDLRVIGGNPGNANQDGMDWLGGGDAVVRNAFIRSSDDVLVVQGNWDGYTDEAMLRPGHDVRNILIEHSVLSTSISNIVRAGWPRKTFNSSNFTLRDSDILHGGIGACGQTFALFGLWGANGAKGIHSDYKFENLFLDNWYSLAQMEQEYPGLNGFTFRNIWALDQPPLADSTMTGDVAGVIFDNVKYGQSRAAADADLPLVTGDGAQKAHFTERHGAVAAFTVAPPVFAPGEMVTFTAQPSPGAHYTWLFGDGTQTSGRSVRHRFADAEGTQLDGAATGAGRFRVLLQVEDRDGTQDWAAHGLVAVAHWHDAVSAAGPMVAGLAWKIYPGEWTELPNLATERAVFAGEGPGLRANSQGYTHYATAWDGLIDIPTDGGYTFYLLARDGARLVIDGVEAAKTGTSFAQVCNSPGNAMRFDRGSLGLRAGKHAFHLEGLHSASEGAPRLLWEGPALPLTDVPPAAYSHPRQDAVKAGNKQGTRD